MSVLKIEYYENGQFKAASGASIFQSSNSQSEVAFKFERDLEDASVFANILLPYPGNSNLYGQYRAQSLYMRKEIDPNGGYIYKGALLQPYLVTDGTAYINAQVQASSGLYQYENTNNTDQIVIDGATYTISWFGTTIDGVIYVMLKLTNNVTGAEYNQVNIGSIAIGEKVYKIDIFDELAITLKLERGFEVDNYQQVEFKITASAPYYAATPLLPEESLIMAQAISKNASDIVDLQQTKQDKDDANINQDGADHTVVGNINTLLQNTSDNTNDISTLQGEMTQAQQDIHDLQVLVSYGVNIVGTMTVQDGLPTDAEVSTYVTSQTGEPPVRGQAVIVRVDYTDDNIDTIYLYVYDGANWHHFEIQFLNSAQNGVKGLIKGNYDIAELITPDTYMVDITNGEIQNIYRVDANGNHIDLKTTMDQVIDKLVGNTPVNRANADEDGNNIKTTYMTQSAGATKGYVQDYASPKALYDLNYPDYALGLFKDENVADSSYNKTTNSTQALYTILATLTKTLSADILLGDQNGVVNRIWISASHTESVKLRVTTQYIDENNVTQTLGIEETATFLLTTGNVELKQIDSVFSGLTTPVLLKAGTTISQTIEVYREESTSADFTLLCNTTYDAYMTLNKIGYVRYALEQEPSAIETAADYSVINADGDLEVSGDGQIDYANGDSAPLTTIVKLPISNGKINIASPTAKPINENAVANSLLVDVSNWSNPLTDAQITQLTTDPKPTILKDGYYYRFIRSGGSYYYYATSVDDSGYQKFISVDTYGKTIASAGNNYYVLKSATFSEYNQTHTYNIGDVVYSNADKKLFVCNTDITTPESWTAAHWTQTTLEQVANPIVSLGTFTGAAPYTTTITATQYAKLKNQNNAKVKIIVGNETYLARKVSQTANGLYFECNSIGEYTRYEVYIDNSHNATITYKMPNGVYVTNSTINANSWSSGSGVNGYDYYKDITIGNVTSDYQAQVTFSLADSESGDLAPICETRSGAVRVFATRNIDRAVVIESIVING